MYYNTYFETLSLRTYFVVQVSIEVDTIVCPRMAKFTFPVLDISCNVVDELATALYPPNAPPGFVTLAAEGDGNCLFHAASVLATGNINLPVMQNTDLSAIISIFRIVRLF